MALPKRRHSTSRQNKRRSQQVIAAPSPSSCTECGKTKLSHSVCKHCGFYKGRQVVQPKQPKEKKEKA